MIIFKQLEVEGFGSIVKPLTYKFPSKGIVGINGENGFGKTTLINAWVWVIYGQTLKKGSSIETWPHVIDKLKDYQFNGTKVSLTFSNAYNSYKIERYKNYKKSVKGKRLKNAVVLYENDTPVKDRDKNDIQNKIIEAIGLSYDLFKASVVFGQKTKRLMEEDGPNKKKILDELFNTKFVKEAENLTKDKIHILNIDKSKLDSLIDRNNKDLEFMESEVNNLTKQKLNFEAIKKDEVDRLYKLLRKEKQNIKIQKNNIIQLEENLQLETKRLNTLQNNLDKDIVDKELKTYLLLQATGDKIHRLQREKENQLEAYKSINKNCIKCGQKLNSKGFKKSKEDIKTQLNKIGDEIILLKKEETKLSGKYKEVEKKAQTNKIRLQKIGNLKIIIYQIETEIKSIIERIKTHKERIHEIEKTIDVNNNKKYPEIDLIPMLQRVDQIKSELLEHTKKLKTNQKELDLYTWAYKGPLSNSGIKAFVFNSTLELINQIIIKNYKKFLEFNIHLSIDNFSANKNLVIKLLDETNNIAYEDLSGGQQQLVNAVLILAINDFITINNPINVMVLDEIFENLSLNNIEIICDILKDKSHNKAIHIITHKTYFDSIFNKKFVMAYNNKISKIEAA